MAFPTTGLFGRYEARLQTGLANLDPVQVATDQSGSGRDLNAFNNTDRRPTYRTAILDGHPVFRFDDSGTTDLMVLDFASVAATAWSMSVVVSSGTAEATVRKWIAYAGNDTTTVMSITEGVTSGEYGTFGRTLPTATVQHTTTGVDTRTWCVLTMVWNGATLAFYRNGTQVGTSTALTGTFALTTLSIGALESDTSVALRNEAFGGDLALAAFWNVALDATARSELHSYVQDTYPSITVSDYSGGGPAPTPGAMTATAVPVAVTAPAGAMVGADPGAPAGDAVMTPTAVAYGDGGWGDGGWGGDPTPLLRVLPRDGGMVGYALPSPPPETSSYVIVGGTRKAVVASYAIVAGARRAAELHRG